MKSPVRENRTPGSVRGLSGNWQSYRDPIIDIGRRLIASRVQNPRQPTALLTIRNEGSFRLTFLLLF